jgi:hypothetical protein
MESSSSTKITSRWASSLLEWRLLLQLTNVADPNANRSDLLCHPFRHQTVEEVVPVDCEYLSSTGHHRDDVLDACLSSTSRLQHRGLDYDRVVASWVAVEVPSCWEEVASPSPFQAHSSSLVEELGQTVLESVVVVVEQNLLLLQHFIGNCNVYD